LRLHRAQLHGVRARLEDSQDALGRPHLAAQAADGGAHGGGVVGEVVVDLHATRLAAQFQAPAHIGEGGQRSAGGIGRHAHMFGRADGSQRVHLVVFAQQLPFHAAQLEAAAQHVESLRFAARAQAAGFLALGAEALHLAPAAARQHALERLVARVDHQAPARRHRAHEVVELGLDRRQVGKDVGVVVFQVVEHGSAWPVMHELAALVEERGVVLVGFDDEGPAVAAGR